MTSVAALIDSLEASGDGWRVTLPDTWAQGRTTYGGLSAALALAVAQRSDADLPPLRSAQVAFVGPLSGDVFLRAQRLRRGRNAAWMQVDIEDEAGVGLRATFVFLRDQPSRVDHAAGTPPAIAAPDAGTPTYGAPDGVVFARNFEFVDPDARLGPAEWLRWVRLRDRAGVDPAVELLAVADCLPPAALKLVGGYAPVSSMTWQIDLLGPPRTRDGWFLLHTDTDHARHGASSQRMAVWNSDGEAVAAQMQSVALFA